MLFLSMFKHSHSGTVLIFTRIFFRWLESNQQVVHIHLDRIRSDSVTQAMKATLSSIPRYWCGFMLTQLHCNHITERSD